MRDLLLLQQRADSLVIDCDYCGQTVGNVCINPKSGHELERQAAHHVRLVAAGVVQPAGDSNIAAQLGGGQQK